MRLAEALALLLEVAATGVSAGEPLAIVTARDQRAVRIDVSPIAEHVPAAEATSGAQDVLLARRLVEAQGGTVAWVGTTMSITLG